ncbi:MAG TPA: succinate--CoA ligase subunit alpha [Deltaproteobacteria bacterium]|nr:CoA-binding protein [Deltaproteobacteria bacterium]HIF63836.1 succinate--CoA ligase subunit alpha [Candidatus Binatota bacterium]HIL13688.1 succinate--CoA ligase subunit alpha [Deltaproteobacteria bacterium]
MGVLVHKDFDFIVQGITGREAVNFTRECLEYGSRIVGGVTPGKGGREVYGVPVYNTVREITEQRKVDGTVITVPLAFAADAAYEAIDAGVKLLVIITEGICRRDAAAFIEYAAQHDARVIGPNCLGVIIPDVCRFGSLGGPAVDCRKAFKPGVVGVMSRSGGMTTEICNALSQAGLGESTAISIGGDPVIGSTYAELMPYFEADEDTKAVVIYSEPGGSSEAELARWAKENNSRLPIVAFVAGRFMDDMHGMSFGHAGTIVEKKLDSPADKIRRMRDAGISVADEIGDIPRLVQERLDGAA